MTSDRRTAASGVRRDKAALSSGCKPHPATAPAGSNRSSHDPLESAAFARRTPKTDFKRANEAPRRIRAQKLIMACGAANALPLRVFKVSASLSAAALEGCGLTLSSELALSAEEDRRKRNNWNGHQRSSANFFTRNSSIGVNEVTQRGGCSQGSD